MGKGKKGGGSASKTRNNDRASGKAKKKNPKPNNYGANGKTVDGYSPAKLEERALKRKLQSMGL